MALQDDLLALQSMNDALIAGPDMGPINRGSNIPDEQTLALQKLQQQNDRIISGKSESTGNAFMDWLEGFNYSARAAIPQMLNAVQGMFTPGMDKLAPQGKWGDIVKGAIESLGLQGKDIDTLPSRIGQQNFYDLLTSAVLLAAAPAAATMTGVGAVPTLARTIGQTTLKHPYLATGEMLGAGAGQQVAEEVAPGNVPVEMAGAIAGGMAVSGTAAAGRRLSVIFPAW